MAVPPEPPAHTSACIAHGVRDDAGELVDVRLEQDGRSRHLMGRGGAAREVQAALAVPPGELPVFLGAGLGAGIAAWLEAGRGPLAVVDNEQTIAEVTGSKARFAGHPDVLWLGSPDSGADPEAVLRELTAWQLAHGGRRLAPLVQPAWLRLNPDFYGPIRARLEAAAKADVFGRLRTPRFAGDSPRVLCLTSRYFLMGEIVAALERMGVEHQLLQIDGEERGSQEFVEELLRAVDALRPDFVLTVNHLGVDREGVLAGLLASLELPLASWFVDNPELVVSLYARLVNPLTAIFTWDADSVEPLREMGFAHVFHLPLGADPVRFAPGRPGLPAWRARVSFVGNSMVYKTARRLDVSGAPPELAARLGELAHGFGESPERSVPAYLRAHEPQALALYEGLASPEQQLAFQTAVIWEATRRYRLERIAQTLEFAPLIAGDPGWLESLPMAAGKEQGWRYHAELSYYDDLPGFYPAAEINFNATSQQMKGAMNQRVFDVPACGAFLLTDMRAQLAECFEPGREVACYDDPGEIPELVRHYLDHPAERERIARAGRERVLAEHGYDRRLATLIARMREAFGS